jgi:tetratricopeptide (TPR) repeat protein
MTESRKPSSQPALSELMARFLERHGLVPASASQLSGEVVPYEAVPAQPVEPRLAWNEAHAALRCFTPDMASDGRQFTADWSALVASYEPAMAIAFCAGNFPQLVRDVHTLLTAKDLSKLCPATGEPHCGEAVTSWAAQLAQTERGQDFLLAAGVCRLARHFDQAEEYLKQVGKQITAEWKPAWLNEQAGLAWHRGQTAVADELWQKQTPSAPVLFNRGMAALFLNRAKEARPLLNQAVEQLPEDDGWHHLGRLYLALAEMRD